MRIFKNKFLVKLIATICLFLTLFNFTGVNRVYADDQVWGGILLTPVTRLMSALGDGIMNILQKSLGGTESSLIHISGKVGWDTVLTWIALAIVVILAIVGFIVVSYATAGLAAAAASAIAGTTFTVSTTVTAGLVVAGLGVGVVTGMHLHSEWFPRDIYLPSHTVSAETIFSNTLPIFDVNFFESASKKADKYKNYTEYVYEDVLTKGSFSLENEEFKDYPEVSFKDWYSVERIKSKDEVVGVGTYSPLVSTSKFRKIINEINKKGYNQIESDWCVKYYARDNYNYIYITKEQVEEKKDVYPEIFYLVVTGNDNENNKVAVYIDSAAKEAKNMIESTYGRKELNELYKNLHELQILQDKEVQVLGIKEQQAVSSATQLREGISTWYYMLRNISLLVLMLILIYTGIRIVIGSTAGEKAKYKERLMDWLVAVCLIFIMHYIMAFAVNLVENVTKLIRTDKNISMVYIPLTSTQYTNATNMNFSAFGVDGTFEEDKTTGLKVDGIFVEEKDGSHSLVWQTDLLGLFKIQSQLENEGTGKWVGYTFCYVILVLMTVFFAFTYAKRVIYIAFLTMIAPLVAMTYPIDKMTDGKAQAFDSWLKEYIFNLMIQPLHLLLYTILVSSAFVLASSNAIYALVAIGFMMPAERLMRKFFGFEKAKTPGLLGGAAGAAIAMTGLQSLTKPRHHGGKSDGGSGSSKSQDQNNIKMSSKSGINVMDEVKNMVGGDVNPQSNNIANTVSNVKTHRQTRDANLGKAQQTGNSKINTPNRIRSKQQLDEKIKQAREANEKAKKELESQKASNNSSDTSATTKKKRSIGRAVGAAFKSGGKQAAVGILRGTHPFKFFGKAALGATVGTAGLLLGVASGDPNKAFQYTTAGIAAGSGLASSLSSNKLFDGEGIKQETEMAYFGEDYKAHVIEKKKKQFIKDRNNINYLRMTLGVTDGQAKDLLDNVGAQCFDNGITNIEDIATICRLTDSTQEDHMTFNQAVAARKYAKRRLPSDPDMMTEKQVREFRARWAQEYKNKYKDLSDAQAQEMANKSFDLAIRFNNTQSSLTKHP